MDIADGSPPVLRVGGEIDIANVEEFRELLSAALASDPTLSVDLAGVTFIDAAGLRVILRAAETLNGFGPLTVVGPARVARLLGLVGVDGSSIKFTVAGAGNVG
jgi:anti-anti-sigma factor